MNTHDIPVLIYLLYVRLKCQKINYTFNVYFLTIPSKAKATLNIFYFEKIAGEIVTVLHTLRNPAGVFWD